MAVRVVRRLVGCSGHILRILRRTLFTQLLSNRLIRYVAYLGIIYLFISGFRYTLCKVNLRYLIHLKNKPNFETDKCSACFGTSICKTIFNEISIDCNSDLISSSSSSSSVDAYYGFLDEKHVLVKRLGSPNDVADMERQLACRPRNEPLCGCNSTLGDLKAFKETRLVEFSKYVTGRSVMTTCSTKRLIERIADKYMEKYDPVLLTPNERIQLVATLIVDQEPIVFQTFSPYDLFPFSLYVGACGRFTVTKVDGQPLQNFFNRSWLTRITIALLLLKTAVLFTENESGFAIYWTDVTLESFTYSEEKNKLFVTDGKHIMVVDKREIREKKAIEWDKPCYSRFDDCANQCRCSLTIPDKLCTSFYADHNYYAICRNILSSYACHPLEFKQKFLHDIPFYINKVYDIHALLDECAKPTSPDRRGIIVKEILKSFETILTNNHLYVPFVGMDYVVHGAPTNRSSAFGI